MLPLSYSLRNLARRPLRTGLTIAGVALVVLLISLLYAFQRGLTDSLENSADPHKVYMVSLGAESDPIRSAIDRGQAESVANDLPGVYADANGRHVSVEVHQVSNLKLPGGSAYADASDEFTAIVRGVEREAFLLHEQVFITEGRAPRGDFEMMAGSLAADRMGIDDAALAIGEQVVFEGIEWKIVGHFVAPGSPIEGELWCQLDDLMTASRRTDVTLVMARLQDADAIDRVDLFCSERLDLQVMMRTEEQWYANLLALMSPIALIGQALALLVFLGGVIGATNTLYAAALARMKELAVVQTIGYRRREVALGLLAESLALVVIAAFAGMSLAAAVGDVSLRMPMGAYRFAAGGEDIAVALMAALLIGVLGALIPSVRIARMPLVDALNKG